MRSYVFNKWVLVYYTQTCIDCENVTYGRASMALNGESAHEFIEVFCYIGFELGDGLTDHWRKYMKKFLCRQLLPLITHFTVHQYNENVLPVSIADFHALNYLLAGHFPDLHAYWRWKETIRYYHEIIDRQQGWIELSTRSSQCIFKHAYREDGSFSAPIGESLLSYQILISLFSFLFWLF